MKSTYTQSRNQALDLASKRALIAYQTPLSTNGKPARISEYYGESTLSLDKLKTTLGEKDYQHILDAVYSGSKMNRSVVEKVAVTVKDWAVSKGATHFTHWFQPQTEGTAEKHDAFLSFNEHDMPIEKLSTSLLLQSEPDASSFPSGGLRSTHKARGYTVWDPKSPFFINETGGAKTLYIPAVFVGYHGQLLDERGGLLRSSEALSYEVCQLLKLIGDEGVTQVMTTLGIEQEYFLVDRAFSLARQDLTMCGRTLLGAQPPKGQQLEDHYFGNIPQRIQSFMAEVEYELYRLGVPIKTRHNEVAPSQFEMAPIFEEADLASDHNLMLMQTVRKVAKKHQLKALFHEKPFAGINGNGKHCNWSMMVTHATDPKLKGINLLEPGKNPHENYRFLLFLLSTMVGVTKHSGLLRAAIASSGNEHRLGANEAPPAIISVFLGDMLSQVLDDIETGINSQELTESQAVRLAISRLPDVMKDTTDRNRTSPFAFTGNKFEFRAVGGSAATAFPMTLLNAAVADGVRDLTRKLDKTIKDAGIPIEKAILVVLKDAIQATKKIRFESNGYSDEWVKEAERRGLQNIPRAPEALKHMVSRETLSLMESLSIYGGEEMHARYHVKLESYIKKMEIEVNTLLSMVKTQVLPSCLSYVKDLAEGAAKMQEIGIEAPQRGVCQQVATLIRNAQGEVESLERSFKKVETASGEEAKAMLLSGEVATKMKLLREVVDTLEENVADAYWPLLKYREILFMN